MLSFKGAGSTVYSDKNITASMNNTLIDSVGKNRADVTILAQNKSQNTNIAGILSAANSSVNVGIGSVWNHLQQNTMAEYTFDNPSEKISNVANFDMRAVNYSSIDTWTGGGTGSYMGTGN